MGLINTKQPGVDNTFTKKFDGADMSMENLHLKAARDTTEVTSSKC